MLTDALARPLRDLRVSVTDRCNFRCSYCMPKEVFGRDFAFVERARRAGIGVPIIPGIMPITNADQIARFTSRCGATIPAALRAALDVRKEEPEAVLDLGVAYATLQCVDLLARGVPAIHFYTLNKSPATRAVVSALLAARPWEPARGRRYLDEEGATVEHAMSLATESPEI